MAKLPEPKVISIRLEPDNEVEDRRKQFFQMVALAIVKASKKGAVSGDGQM
jgi:hypothetical protein